MNEAPATKNLAVDAVPSLAMRDIAEPVLRLGAADFPRLSDVLTVVDLDAHGTSTRTDLTDVAAVLAESPRVLVGVTTRPLPPQYDPVLAALSCTLSAAAQRGTYAVVTADPARTVTELLGRLAVTPVAAVVLAGVLRGMAALRVRDALTAESLAFSTLLAGPEFAAWRSRRPARSRPLATGRDPARLESRSELLRVVLDSPARRNAIDRAMRDRLVDLLTIVALDDSPRPVEVCGSGPAFCSGGDLDEFGTARDPASAHVLRTAQNVAWLMHRCSGRMVVRLHGACVGAGIELPAFAARVTARPDTVLRLPEVGMGLIPGSGGTVSIPRRIGRWRTAYWALSGDALDAKRAREWGLVDEVVDR